MKKSNMPADHKFIKNMSIRKQIAIIVSGAFVLVGSQIYNHTVSGLEKAGNSEYNVYTKTTYDNGHEGVNETRSNEDINKLYISVKNDSGQEKRYYINDSTSENYDILSNMLTQGKLGYIDDNDKIKLPDEIKKDISVINEDSKIVYMNSVKNEDALDDYRERSLIMTVGCLTFGSFAIAVFVGPFLYAYDPDLVYELLNINTLEDEDQKVKTK